MAETSTQCNARYKCKVDIVFNKRCYKSVELYVLKNLCADVLLGNDFQSRLKRVIFEQNGSENDLVVRPAAGFETCAVAAASLESPPLFANLTSNCKPIATKARRFNAADAEFIRLEIAKWFQNGIIRPSQSPWCAQVVVVKSNNQKRLCVDYSQTVNLFTELDAYPIPNIEEIVHKLSKYSAFATYDLKSAYHQVPFMNMVSLLLPFKLVTVCWNSIEFPLVLKMAGQFFNA